VLDNLGLSLIILNRYFKQTVVGELWDIEKFSLKEATVEPDVEKYSTILNDITTGILILESSIMGNSIKNWREIKNLYVQIISIIDGAVATDIEDPNKPFMVTEY